MSLSNRIQHVRILTLVSLFCVVAMLAIATSLVFVYVVSTPNKITEALQRALPYPMVLIGYRDGITYQSLAENMEAVRHFYEAQDFSAIGMRIDFSTDMGKQRFAVRKKEVLNKMIEDKAMVLLAEKRDISVSAEEAAHAISRKLEEYKSNKEVLQELERLYGWTLMDFQNKVVVPELYQEKLRARFMTEVDTTSVGKKRIDTAQQALRSQTPFATVAKEYSEGSTANDGGSLGWFSAEDVAIELYDAVMTQKIGVPGEVIESELGFHIVLVEETKQEDQKTLYRLSQIFTRKVTFSDWLTEQMRTLPIFVLSPEYRWNTQDARVEFKQLEMRDFEKKLFETADESALFLF